MPETVISNTSPIYYLNQLNLLYILNKMYGEIYIPKAVVSELKEGERLGLNVPFIKEITWIKIKKVSIPATLIGMIPDFGKGEAEVLSLACEYKNTLLIIDEKVGRNIARLNQFKITGTAGVLMKAKKNGYIKSLKPYFLRLKELRFYLSDKVINDIFKISGE